MLRTPARVFLPILFLGATALACQTEEAARNTPLGKPEPYVPLPDQGPEPIGFFVTNLDRSLQQWSELKLSGSSSRDQNVLLALEVSLTERTQKRRDELLSVLETGAPANRRIVAAALGFTHDPTVLGALLAVLDEHDPELVQKALLGIGILAQKDTPLGAVRAHLVDAPESWTRNNAAFALLAIASAGNTSSELSEACRAGLADSEPGVRSQCASALGVLADPTSVTALHSVLLDETNLAALAAAAALARIGHEHPEQKGATARALAGALDSVKTDRRVHLLGALRWLSGIDMGEDASAWLTWAHKLP
jgi:HEAT repeat protein